MSSKLMDLPLRPLKTAHLINAALLFLGLYVAVSIVSAVRNPLRKIPGPWYTNFTRLRLKWAIITANRVHYVEALHQKYGPHVRIAPNEVAVADPKSFGAIHKIGSGFTKPNWYREVTGSMEQDTIFTMTDPKQHGARRKLFTRGFSKSYLRQSWEPMVHDKVKMAVSKIKADASSKTGDVMKWFLLMATDVTVHLSFGESFKMIETGELGAYMDAVLKGLIGNGLTSEMMWVRHIGRLLPGETARNYFRSNEVVGEYARPAIANSKKEGGGNVFSTIEIGPGFGEDDIVAEATVLIVAGSDSTAVSLTFLVYMVLTHPAVQKELEAEVATLPVGYTDSDTENLPLLGAVIQESMRLYGAVNTPMPRVVPPSGATLGGYFLPGGTVATTQAHSIHRDATLYPEPLKWDPSRWASMSAAGKAAFHPFGAGARTCLGINIAQMEMRLAVCEFFRECAGARLAPSVTPESMAIEQTFLLAPIGHKCEIVLRA